LALQEGAEIIVETDDDNFPGGEFWESRSRNVFARIQNISGWSNVYRYFSDSNIWPRGFPLEEIHEPLHPIQDSGIVDSPIQQGLTDANPDVDAVYRLTMSLPQSFRKENPVALGKEVWCPFNSQNTTWWREVAHLMYLPSYCSFRMTDIWRSFVAQRIAWENRWTVTFHQATVCQHRNVHNLLCDFEEEIAGYLGNAKMVKILSGLSLKQGAIGIPDNLRTCYSALVGAGFFKQDEMVLLDAWLADLGKMPIVAPRSSL
jgi:hypothetical protein